MKDKFQIKMALYKECEESTEIRIRAIEKILESITEARNNETKSSAGDKYETGRAMLQIEEENSKRQLHQALLLRNQLEQFEPAKQTDKVMVGSLVITDQANYFISVGLGKIILEDKVYYCISGASPIGQKLMNRIVGDKFEFNGKTMEILEIY